MDMNIYELIRGALNPRLAPLERAIDRLLVDPICPALCCCSALAVAGSSPLRITTALLI